MWEQRERLFFCVLCHSKMCVCVCLSILTSQIASTLYLPCRVRDKVQWEQVWEAPSRPTDRNKKPGSRQKLWGYFRVSNNNLLQICHQWPQGHINILLHAYIYNFNIITLRMQWYVNWKSCLLTAFELSAKMITFNIYRWQWQTFICCVTSATHCLNFQS